MEDSDAIVLTILCLSEGFNRGSARGPIRASLSVVLPSWTNNLQLLLFSFLQASVLPQPSRRRGQRIQVTACLPAPVTHTRRGWCVLGHQPVVTVTLCVPVRRLRRCVSELWLLPWPPSRAWPGPRARSLLFASSCLLKTTGVVGRGSRIQSVLDSGEKGTLSNKFPGGWIRIPCQANPGNNVLDGGEEWRARRLASLNHVVFGDADASATLAKRTCPPGVPPTHPIFPSGGAASCELWAGAPWTAGPSEPLFLTPHTWDGDADGSMHLLSFGKRCV